MKTVNSIKNLAEINKDALEGLRYCDRVILLNFAKHYFDEHSDVNEIMMPRYTYVN